MNEDFLSLLKIWEELLKEQEDPHKSPLYVYIGCAYFYLGMFKEADAAASGYTGPPISLQNRLQFHLAHKFNDEARLMYCHQKLHDTTEDKLSFAAIHYLRSHYNEAIEIYKRILLENRYFLSSICK